MSTAAVDIRTFTLLAMQAADAIPARRSLTAFMERTYPDYQRAFHIDVLCEALEMAITTPNSRLIVTLPPRHSKSVHVSEGLPAYFLGKYPDKRIITASHTAQLAYTFSRRVRNKINAPDWPFTSVQVADDKGAVQAWDIANHQGGYIAVGVGGSPVGHGADLIAIDDPTRSAADADSETSRDALWEWYQGTLRTRLHPGGSIILTATRWHGDDLTGRLIEAERTGGEHWEHIHMPAISDDGEALWPEYWSLDALEGIRKSVGSRVWESQYQGRPMPLEGGILKPHWFGTYVQPQVDYLAIVQAWDTAFKTGEDNDSSACVTIGVGIAGYDVLDVYDDKLEFPDLERAFEQQHLIWSMRYPKATFSVLVEDKASGQSLIQSARRRGNRNINVIAIPVARGEDKIQRVNEISPTVEAQRVRLPVLATWREKFIHEVTNFPLVKHNDITDAFSMAIKRVAGIGAGGHASGRSLRDSPVSPRDQREQHRRLQR